MATRNKPYDSFGPFILFKKLEMDALGDLWRAAQIDGGQLGPALAVRRLSGGNREALTASAHAAAEIVPQLTGASFVRGQVVGVADGLPFLAWEYQGGRSLRYIVDRARGGTGVPAHPIPMDQAIVIAEKVALSLATTSELRDGGGKRLAHGALLPQFVWISDDGEIRVAGQLLSEGITASLADQRVSGEIARYFAPESRGTQKNGEVYALGALLFLLVTGQEPPDAATASAFGAAVRAAKTMAGAPVPDDIRIILDKSFNLDPSMRYQSIGDMKQALTALANGGKYSATTFNLAFYLSNLLKKEMEAEALDREKEAKVNVAPYLEVSKAAAAPQTQIAATAAPDFGAPAEKKSRAPMAIAAGVAIAAISAGGWMMFKKTSAPAAPAAAPVKAQAIPVKPKPVIISEPIVASGSPETATTAPVPATTDSVAQQRAFEDAVRAKMQAEMMKLQDQFMADLKKSQPKQAPVTIAAAAASEPQPERTVPSAAQLDQQRRETREETTSQAAAVVPQPAPVQTQTVAQPQQQIANTQTTAPAPARAVVREGDIVNVTALDVVPKAIRVVTPLYPAMARSQRLAAVIVVSALINENGQVADVKVLRGEPRFGLNDAAVRAMRATRFSSPMKDGKKVKTWFPQQIEFKP
jgi:TonB family protein